MITTTSNKNDIHFKLCKKVAQLTKIIYQLHTINDSHQIDCESREAAHKAEIESVIFDASSKIIELREQVDYTQCQLRNKLTEYSLLQSNCEYEKELAEKSLYSIKQSIIDRERVLKDIHLKEVHRLQSLFNQQEHKYDQLVHAFDEKLIKVQTKYTSSIETTQKQFQTRHEELQNKLVQNTTKHSQEIEQIKDEHSQTVASLKKRFLQQEQELKNDMTLQQEKLKDLKNQIKSDFLLRLKETRDLYEQQQERCHEHFQTQLKEVQEQRDSSLKISEDLRGTIQNLEEKLEQSQALSEKKIIMKERELWSASQAVKGLQADLWRQNNKNDIQEAELTTCQEKVVLLQKAFKDMKNKYDLVMESTNMTKEDHNSVLLKVERTIKIISDDLDRAHNSLQEKEMFSDGLSRLLRDEKDIRGKELRSFQKQLHEKSTELAVAKDVNNQLRTEMDQLHETSSVQLQNIKDEIIVEAKRLQEKFSIELNKAKEEWENSLKSCTRKYQERETIYASKVEHFEILLQREQQKSNQHEATSKIRSKEYEYTVKQRDVQINSLLKACKERDETIASLKSAVNNSEKQSIEDHKRTQEKINALEHKVSLLKHERTTLIENKDKINDDFVTKMIRMKEMCRYFGDKMTQQQAELSELYRKRLHDFEQRHKATTQIMEKIFTKRTEMMHILANMENTNNGTEWRRTFEPDLMQTVEAFSKEKYAMQSNFNDVKELSEKITSENSRLMSEYRESQEKYLTSLQEKEKLFSITESSKIHEIETRHQLVIEQIQQEHANQVQMIESKNERELSELKSDLTKNLNIAIDKARTVECKRLEEKEHILNTEIKKLQKELEDNIHQMSKSDLHVTSLQNQLIITKMNSENIQNESKSLHQRLSQIKKDTDMAKAQATKLSVENHKLEQKLLEVKENSEKMYRDQQNNFNCKIRKDREAHRELVERIKKENKDLLEQMNSASTTEIQAKNRILQETVENLRIELKTTKDEMNFFRRELLNREENYNNTFSGNPNRSQGPIGVINVMKQRNNGESYGNVSHRRSSTKGSIRINTTLPRI